MTLILMFLLKKYPDRQWSLPEGGSIEDLIWHDGAAPIGLEQKWADFDPDFTPVPTTATPAQGLMALYQLKGITEDDIESAIAGISDPGERYAAQIAYRKTTVWELGSPSMQSIGALLQLTEQDFIDLFTLAPTIKL